MGLAAFYQKNLNRIVTTASNMSEGKFQQEKNGILLAWKYVFLIIFGPWAEQYRLFVQRISDWVSKTALYRSIATVWGGFFSEEIFRYIFGFKQKLPNIKRTISGALSKISRRGCPICLLRVQRSFLTIFFNKIKFSLAFWDTERKHLASCPTFPKGSPKLRCPCP